MAARKPPRASVAHCCEEVNARGRRRFGEAWKSVTPRKIERWDGAGLLPPVSRPGRGRGRGRQAIYTTDHADAIYAISAFLQSDRRLRFAPLAVFMASLHVAEDRLRSAFLDLEDEAPRHVRDGARKNHADAVERNDAAKDCSSLPPAPSTVEDQAAWFEPSFREIARSARFARLDHAADLAGVPIGAFREEHGNHAATLILGGSKGGEEIRGGLDVLGLSVETATIGNMKIPSHDERRAIVQDATLADFESARTNAPRLGAIFVDEANFRPTPGVVGESRLVLNTLHFEASVSHTNGVELETLYSVAAELLPQVLRVE